MTLAALGAILLVVLLILWWRQRPSLTLLVLAIFLGVIIKSSSDGFLEQCVDAVLKATRTVLDWLAGLFK
ncbi:hypothetical protein E1211_29760 [Micromonospora sp. 15K316]|uniref:hypothetical protein n=1 Tax=Micromonospora sp. 15K316 TaxID=2530376 RepID=UPI001052EF6B|nr:hypothetical protein [Micromonospora sp. 15K316]TDC26885.1 hypothetical protein E1211_29760 [Micromonospora sp. 15K316]